MVIVQTSVVQTSDGRWDDTTCRECGGGVQAHVGKPLLVESDLFGRTVI